MTDDELKSLEAELLQYVPASGSKGNVSLMRTLDWPEETYWLIRKRLIDNGVLETGRGKGGSVLRVGTDTDAEVQIRVQEPDSAEGDLYPCLLLVLQNEWGQNSGAEDLHVEITGHQGSRSTGKWARPDITAIMYRVFPYIPGKHIDTVVFEVKPKWSIDVTAVYEALGHRRAANRAYVIVVHDEPLQIEKRLDELLSEARKFGVGVIVVKDPGDWKEWDIKVEAVRHEPDPERHNAFLASQISDQAREILMKWFK